MDYNESIHIMIEFISHHPIAIPFTKIANPKLPVCILHMTFERVKIENDVLEVEIADDQIVPLHKSTFLKAICIKENPKGFRVQEPKSEEFHSFLNQIG